MSIKLDVKLAWRTEFKLLCLHLLQPDPQVDNLKPVGLADYFYAVAWIQFWIGDFARLNLFQLESSSN
jgi:hypothetical protein